jgi:hypothetical protein
MTPAAENLKQMPKVPFNTDALMPADTDIAKVPVPTMQNKQTRVSIYLLAAASAALAFTGTGRAADASSPSTTPDAAFWTKPAWLSELTFAVKETYDDNVLGVSGIGMPVQTSWVNDVSARIGINFVPLLDDKDITAFSLTYNPEAYTYADDSNENYIAHRVIGVLKGKADGATYSFDDAFLYNDGNKVAPTYALNQLAGAAANQNDKFRNNFAHSLARERRNQIQDRYNAWVKINDGNFFIRPISSLTYYDLNTELFNTSVAPYKGYQDYVSRYDVNAGADLGFDLTPAIAVFVGYRDGYQHQDQFALAINSDQHFSSNRYQRALLGLEGKLTPWLTAKLSGGPDFRDFNASTPISDRNTTRFYGEASLVAALPNDQSLNFAYKQWVFVASTGLVPYTDTSVTLAYHWNVTKQFGLDVAAKYLEANYTMGNDIAGSAPSRRDDVDEGASAGVTFAVTKQFILSLAYNYDKGLNNLDGLPATLFPAYRDFTHGVTTLGATYKF